MLRYLFWCLLAWLPLLIQGQVDTTIAIETIEIRAKKIREAPTGTISLRWDQASLQSSNADNIADLLEQESNVFIKSYGLNSLATSSIRGGSAGHTLVLWNGLPVHSPMLGLLDLSLLSTNLAEEISLEKGGNTANWGGGAVGGLIRIDNRAVDHHKNILNLRSKVGAFGEWKQEASFTLQKHKLQSTTRFSHHQANNDFPFRPAPGLAQRRQENAAFSLQNLLQSLYWTPNTKQQFALHYWWQSASRNIPPTIVQNNSEAYQDDLAHRLVFDWQYQNKTYLTNFKAGLFSEDLNYFDPEIGLEALSHFDNIFSEISNQWLIDTRSSISLGFLYNYTQATADGYQDGVHENRSALFANYQLSRRKLQLNIGLRQEWVQNRWTPLAPSLALDYNCFSFFQIKAKVSKNYRLPTLNDRFWKPGGNEDLLAENGWSEELSFLFSKINTNHIFHFTITAFNRNIDNWILWSIRPGEQFWSANNIAKVWSRGLESGMDYTFYKNNFKLKIGFAYDYIRSTNQIALAFPSIQKGEQLLYTPQHQAHGKIDFEFKKIQFVYRHYYTGQTRGINEAIEDYQTADIDLRYRFSLAKAPCELFFTIRNLWDQDYFVIERRPMPGRYWQAGANWTIKR